MAKKKNYKDASFLSDISKSILEIKKENDRLKEDLEFLRQENARLKRYEDIVVKSNKDFQKEFLCFVSPDNESESKRNLFRLLSSLKDKSYMFDKIMDELEIRNNGV